MFQWKIFNGLRDFATFPTNVRDKIYLILSGTISHPVSFTFFLCTCVQFRTILHKEFINYTVSLKRPVLAICL